MTYQRRSQHQNINKILPIIASSMISACSVVINYYKAHNNNIKNTDTIITVGNGFETHFQCFEHKKTKKETYVITFGIKAIADKITAHEPFPHWTTEIEISSGKYMMGKLTPFNLLVHTVLHECAHLLRYSSVSPPTKDNEHDHIFHDTLKMMYSHRTDLFVKKQLLSDRDTAKFFNEIVLAQELLANDSAISVYCGGKFYIGYILHKGKYNSNVAVVESHQHVDIHNILQCTINNESIFPVVNSNRIISQKVKCTFETHKNHINNKLVTFSTQGRQMIGSVTSLGRTKATVTCIEMLNKNDYKQKSFSRSLVPYTDLKIIEKCKRN